MGDVVSRAMVDATALYGGARDGVFNGACFSAALARRARVAGCIDGHVVAAVLADRTDVVALAGGSHYRLKWWRRWLCAARCLGCDQLVPTHNGSREYVYCLACQERGSYD